MKKKNPQNRREAPPAKPLRTQVLDVVDVAFGGDGIAREEGKVIFIAGGIPGEKVEAEITTDKARFAKAKVKKVLSPAMDAKPAFCPVFSQCGGCDWQTVAYEKQIQWKQKFIESALQKISGLTLDHSIEIHGSKQLKAFRNRIKLKLSLSNGRMTFAYNAKGSHDMVAINNCPIAEEPIQKLIQKLSSADFQKDWNWRGEAEIQALEDGLCLVHFYSPFPFQKVLQQKFPEVHWGASDSIVFERFDGLEYRTRGGQFQQVNREGNHELRRWIQAKVQDIAPRVIVDMFSGSGNLSLGLATLNPTPKIYGIEYSELAIATARDNVKKNQLKGLQYKAGPAKDIRKIFPELPEILDCVITDPPRQGMDDSIEDLLSLNPKHILSVSCDPNTFARDLKILISRGYELREIRGMDFFPHSYHIETLAHLIRVSD